MPQLRSLARCAALAAVALALLGCPSLVRPPPPSVDTAETLARRGDSAGAAKVWEALAAAASGPERADFLLHAASAWLRAGLVDSAAAALAGLPATLTAPQALERTLLETELDLARGKGGEAWARIAALRAPTGPAEAARYLALRERAAFAGGRPVEGVRAEIERERYLPDAATRVQGRAALLQELRSASARGVRLDTAGAREPVVRGWLEVGSIVALAERDSSAVRPQFDAWRSRYPAHPAADVVRTELLGEPVVASGPVTAHVALLLPVTGRQASAATAVRDGFLTASARTPEATRPLIRVYDTAAMTVSEAIAQATADGAEFIVGPLTREELLVASDYTAQRAPLLALNFLPAERTAPDNFYQFALSPEDEARQVARRALARGQRRGVALAPAGDWGERVLAAFTEEFVAGGGVLLAHGELDPSKADFSATITEVLRINESRARWRRLESLLGATLAFEPRRRADVDFIFSPTQAAMARLLRPQLKFYFAGDIPTYATSDAYDPAPTANEDLDGLLFPEMPWMLGTGALSQDLRDAAKDAPAGGAPRRGRLFAFGFDAYNLVAALRGPAPLHLEGLTGTLTLGPDRRVRRELAWARMHGGEAELVAQASE